jgi:hypothetical protein
LFESISSQELPQSDLLISTGIELSDAAPEPDLNEAQINEFKTALADLEVLEKDSFMRLSRSFRWGAGPRYLGVHQVFESVARAGNVAIAEALIKLQS